MPQKTTVKAARKKVNSSNSKKASLSGKTKKNFITRQEFYSMVEKRAFELYLEKGGWHGGDEGDWLSAEKEISKRYSLH